MHMPFLSFFSKRLYRDVGRNWKGANFAYLFLLLAICCIPATLHLRNTMLKSIETSQVDLLNQLPDISIRNGQAFADVKQPHYINNRSGDALAIIDTTGSMNYIADPTVMVLLTETKLIVRRGKNLFNAFDLEGIEDFSVDKHAVNGWLQTLRETVAPLSYGIFLMLSYVLAVLTMLLMAIVGLILSSFMNGQLKFSEALRIASVAATPAIIFVSISAAMSYSIPIEIYLGVTLLYLFIGLKVCSSAPETVDDEDHVDLKAVLKEDESESLFGEAA